MAARFKRFATDSIGQDDPASGLPNSLFDGDWGRTVLWPTGARWRGAMWLVAIFCGYVGAVLLYRPLAPDGVALVWLPNAVLATALLKFRRRDWPYVYAAGLTAEVVAGDLTLDVLPQQALYLGLANAAEATLFVLLAAQIARGRSNIGLLSIRGVAALIIAAIAVPAVIGTLGAIGWAWAFDADYLTAWRNWWFSDSLGLLVGVPIGMLFRDGRRSVGRRRSRSVTVGGGSVAAVLWVLSVGLEAVRRDWEATRSALASAVLLSLAFGAIGAPLAATLATTLALIGLDRQEQGVEELVRFQTLLVVVFAAVYAIAAAVESADRVIRDLSATKHDLAVANERLAFLSHTDELTGLSNRRVLSENLELLWAWCVRESKQLAMLMIDIDCFHQYNATYGHVAGDSVLRRMGPVIQGAARRKTDLAVRYGGEEFLIVLPGASLEDAEESAGRIHRQIRELDIEHSSSSVASSLTVSIGVLALQEPGPGSATAALERCDALLFEAKGAGRNRTVAGYLQSSDSLSEPLPAAVSSPPSDDATESRT